MFSKSAVLLFVLTSVFYAHCNLLEDGQGPILSEQDKRALLDNPNLAAYLQQMLSYVNTQGSTASSQSNLQSSSQLAQSSGASSNIAVQNQQSLSQSSSSSVSTAESKQASSLLSASSSEIGVQSGSASNQLAEILNGQYVGGQAGSINQGAAVSQGSSLLAHSAGSVSSSNSNVASSNSVSTNSVTSNSVSSNSVSSNNAASQAGSILSLNEINSAAGHSINNAGASSNVQGSSLLSQGAAVASNSASSQTSLLNQNSAVSSISNSAVSSNSVSSNNAASQTGSILSLNEINSAAGHSINSGAVSSNIHESSLLSQGSSLSSNSASSSISNSAASSISNSAVSSSSNLASVHQSDSSYIHHMSEEEARQAKDAKYHFSTFIDDNIKGNMHEREEIRENGVTRGAFAYDDGHIRRIVYYHDDGHGMVITRDDITPSQKAKGTLNGQVSVKTTMNGETVAYTYSAEDLDRYRKMGLSASV